MTWSLQGDTSVAWSTEAASGTSYSAESSASNTYTSVGYQDGYVRAGYMTGNYVEPDVGTDWTPANPSSTSWA